HEPADLDRWFTDSFRTGATTDSIATFRDGMADILIFDYRDLGDFGWLEWIAWTLATDGITFPRGSRRHFPRIGVLSRLAADGIAGWVSVGNRPETLMRVGTNSGREILEGIAARAGYKAEISDKGRVGIAVLGLLRDTLGLAVLSSSKVYG